MQACLLVKVQKRRPRVNSWSTRGRDAFGIEIIRARSDVGNFTSILKTARIRRSGAPDRSLAMIVPRALLARGVPELPTSSWIASDSAILEPSIRIRCATRSSPLGVKSPGQALTPSRAFPTGQGLHCPLVDHYLARRPPPIRASAASCDPPHDGAV